ncbi:hypothetical protein FRC08_016718 [Ceratobasidium sp. 394]|nr:hypothetical protein FRC08_016718 [Ceratobasidium sp. 394]
MSQCLQTHTAWTSSTIATLKAKINALEEECLSVSKGKSSGSDFTQIMKSELMHEMERRWEAWHAWTEEECEVKKRTLAAAIEEVCVVVDSHRHGAECVDAIEARMGAVEGQLASVE